PRTEAVNPPLVRFPANTDRRPPRPPTPPYPRNTWRPSRGHSVTTRRGLHGARRLRVDPVEVLDVLLDLRVAEALIRHRQVVEFLQHGLCVGIGLGHLLRRLQPSRQPRVAAP